MMRPKNRRSLGRCAGPIALFVCGFLSAGEDWRQFRGSDSSAVAATASIPTSWDVERREKIAWSVGLPGRGLSSPIIVGDRVILTASSGAEDNNLHVLSFDRVSGTKHWERRFWATGLTQCHPKMCMATPTPASDGERVVAFYSSNDLVCLDLDGNVEWVRGLTHDYPAASNSVGMSSSPIIVAGTVIVQVENDSESFAAGIDIKTGVNRWKIDRPARVNWTSPIVIPRVNAASMVLLQSIPITTGHDPLTGDTLWEFPGGAGAIPSATRAGETILLPSNGITAIRLDQATLEPEVLWQERRLRLGTASAAVRGGSVYALAGSILHSASLESGDIEWRLRLEGPFSATPVIAGNHLYAINEKGLAQVVALGGESGEIVATSDFGETILCTPAIAGDAMFVRSDEHLWRISGEN